MNISLEKNNLYRAIGELAYVIARSDSLLTQLEKTVFREAVKEELGEEGWATIDRFEYLDHNNQKPTLDQSYNRAIYTFRQNRQALSPDLAERFVSLLEKVGGVSGITDRETLVIEQFQADLSKILE
jgi:hypothetical protein